MGRSTPHSTPAILTLERLPTGVHGLDAIVNGGLLQSGMYAIVGPPGSGKTILANQICFSHVAGGGRAVYVTLLTETHDRMLAHIGSLSFFDSRPIADTLNYISGYHTLDQEGLSGLLDLLRGIVRDYRASLLVLDGLGTAEEAAESPLAFKRFIHELQLFVGVTRCTTLLLNHPDDSTSGTGYAMVDGWIDLTHQHVGLRAVRELEVRKFRGSSYIAGQHTFNITDAGIAVYPRTEALLASPSPAPDEKRVRVPFGIPRLDDMLHGGLLSGSTTMLLGAPGSGKTLTGLTFLATGARLGEPGLHFGFYETPTRLITKADEIGLEMSRFAGDGLIGMIWQPPLENNLDPLAESLLDTVQTMGVRRLFIDGLHGFHEAAIYPYRISRFFTALTNELRVRNVTTLLSVETPDLFSPAVEVPVSGIAAGVDNIVLLRYVELKSQLYRLISIMKVRESAYDMAIREFTISERGIDVAGTFESAEAVLTGRGHPRSLPDDQTREASNRSEPPEQP
jgi:circadian clock protein KaiC